MSWDLVIFNSKQKIEEVENIDESQLDPTDFNAAFASHFNNIVEDGTAREIVGDDFTIVYYIHDELVSNTLVNMYGEKGLYELILLAQKYNWQIFDTGLGQMIDLEDPSKNGYENFQQYLNKVLKL